MYYFKVTDVNGNEYGRSIKSFEEAHDLAVAKRNELKVSMTIWSTEPVRKTANFYEHGYHAKYWLDYEPTTEQKINDDLYILRFEQNGKEIELKPTSKSIIDVIVESSLKKENIPYTIERVN